MQYSALLVLTLVALCRSNPIFHVSYASSVYEWKFGSTPVEVFTPPRSVDKIAVDRATNTTYWSTVGSQNYIYKQVLGNASSQQIVYSSPTGGSFVSSLWVDSPNYLYCTLANNQNGVW